MTDEQAEFIRLALIQLKIIFSTKNKMVEVLQNPLGTNGNNLLISKEMIEEYTNHFLPSEDNMHLTKKGVMFKNDLIALQDVRTPVHIYNYETLYELIVA